MFALHHDKHLDPQGGVTFLSRDEHMDPSRCVLTKLILFSSDRSSSSLSKKADDFFNISRAQCRADGELARTSRRQLVDLYAEQLSLITIFHVMIGGVAYDAFNLWNMYGFYKKPGSSQVGTGKRDDGSWIKFSLDGIVKIDRRIAVVDAAMCASHQRLALHVTRPDREKLCSYFFVEKWVQVNQRRLLKSQKTGMQS